MVVLCRRIDDELCFYLAPRISNGVTVSTDVSMMLAVKC
jgi:hypothetical protein